MPELAKSNDSMIYYLLLISTVEKIVKLKVHFWSLKPKCPLECPICIFIWLNIRGNAQFPPPGVPRIFVFCFDNSCCTGYFAGIQIQVCLEFSAWQDWQALVSVSILCLYLKMKMNEPTFNSQPHSIGFSLAAIH